MNMQRIVLDPPSSSVYSEIFNFVSGMEVVAPERVGFAANNGNITVFTTEDAVVVALKKRFGHYIKS